MSHLYIVQSILVSDTCDSPVLFFAARHPVVVEETEEEWLAAMPEEKRKAIQNAQYWRQLDVKEREENARHELRKQIQQEMDEAKDAQQRATTVEEYGMKFAISKYGKTSLIAFVVLVLVVTGLLSNNLRVVRSHGFLPAPPAPPTPVMVRRRR